MRALSLIIISFLIIINSYGNESKTYEILKNASDNYGFIKCIQIKNLSESMTPKKNALNEGIEFASGEVIINTDASLLLFKINKRRDTLMQETP